LQIERLENRRLLVGTTIITHGHQFDDTPDVDGWVDTMADEIRSRVPDVPYSTEPITAKYTLRLDGDRPDSIVGHSLVREDGSLVTGIEGASGEVIIKLDWTDQARGWWGEENSTRWVGEYVAEELLDGFGNPDVFNFLAGPVHLIGHSRGASVNTAIAEKFAEHGVWIDQFTTLDPHPASWTEDTEIVLWDSIRFADNYRRKFIGEDVDDSYSITFVRGDLNGGYGDRWFADHSDVHLWYHGTVDTEADPIDDGEASVSANAGWYENERGPRDGNGFYFSRIAGGDRTGVASEGLAHPGNRDSGHPSNDDQWANLDAPISYDARTYLRGSHVVVSYRYQASDDCTITFGHDSDRNPFNGAHDTETVNMAPTQSTSGFDDGSVEAFSLDTNHIGYGAHYLYAKIESADGHVRYSYGTERITVLPWGRPIELPRPPYWDLLMESSLLNGSRQLAASPAPPVPNRTDLMTPVMQELGRLPRHEHDGGDQTLHLRTRRSWDGLDFLLDSEFEALSANGRVNLRAVDTFFAARTEVKT